MYYKVRSKRSHSVVYVILRSGYLSAALLTCTGASIVCGAYCCRFSETCLDGEGRHSTASKDFRGHAISSGTTETSTYTPDSYPTCSKCRNHWLKIRVKGHKRFCKYRDCTCEKCSLVAEGQKISALRMAVWRAQAQDEAHVDKQVSQYRRTACLSLAEPHLPWIAA